MNPNYPAWLTEQKYAENTQTAQIHRVKKVEDTYSSLDDRFKNGTYQELIDALTYSTEDERANKPNPSKIKFDGNVRKNLQSYKSAVVRYRKFLMDNGFQNIPLREQATGDVPNQDTTTSKEFSQQRQQRFSLERDMQANLRLNIANLDPGLKIIDDGAERSVNSGFIDITCEDANGFVVVELKAGTADSRAIGQIPGIYGRLARGRRRQACARYSCRA